MIFLFQIQISFQTIAHNCPEADSFEISLFSLFLEKKRFMLSFFSPDLNHISITTLNICSLCDRILCDKDYAGLHSDVRSASDKLMPKGGAFSPKMRRLRLCISNLIRTFFPSSKHVRIDCLNIAQHQ